MRQILRRRRSTYALTGEAVWGRRRRRLAPAIALATLSLVLGPALDAGATPAPEPKPVNTAAPVLSGVPAVGQTLSCSQGAWSNNPVSFAYVWLRDGAPIAGQTGSTYLVQAADAGHSISCRVIAANSGGEYTISGLPSGSYNVSFAGEFEESNYLYQYFNGKSFENEATKVAVTSPHLTTGINAGMLTGGQIAGTVTAASGGATLAGVLVCASETPSHHYNNCAVTNGSGAYVITSLGTGTYSVSFLPFLTAGNYLSQTVGGVAVTTGATSALNAALASGGQISGKVSGTEGGAEIEACADEVPNQFPVSCAITNGAGEYTISSLPTGKYKVEFIRNFSGGNYQPQFYKEQSSYAAATEVSVTAGSVTTGIDAAMLAGGRISGKVTAAVGGAPLEGIEVCAIEESQYVSCTETNGSGEYAVVGLSSGKYKVAFLSGCGLFGCTNNYLTQYYNGKVTLAEGEEVTVAAPGTVSNINAQMQTGGQISGRATSASGGAGVANVLACASEETSEYNNCTFTGSGGEYTIPGLPTGTYNVEFFPEEENGNYLPQSVHSVSVNAGSTTPNIDVTLQPGGQITGRVTAAAGGGALAKIRVCASDLGVGGNCALTNGGGGSASATSGALAIASLNHSQFSLVKTKFDAKKGDLDFFFKVATAGTFHWSLFFQNADVGFADSLGVSLGDTGALAETAKKKGKSRKCKHGYTKHHGRCVRILVPFASGSKTVPAGTVEVKVHAGGKALKALKAGRTLHVSGTFTFQSALGGLPVTHAESAIVRMPPKKHHHKK